MTEVITPQTSAAGSPEPTGSQPEVLWAPREPETRKRRWPWLIGIPAALLLAGVVTASLLLIAPGTTVAGVNVGFLTPGAATDAIRNQLASTEVTLGEGGASVTGADVGATVDAPALAQQAFDEHPLWNVTQWFASASTPEVVVDDAATAAALQEAAPDLYTAPTPAGITFADGTYSVSKAVDGEGIDPVVVTNALRDAFASGTTTTTIEPVAVPIASITTTEAAQATADQLNALLEKVGFYVGDERTVEVTPQQASEWVSVSTNESGEFVLAADAAKIQSYADGLAEEINQDAKPETIITNEAGDTLRVSIEGQDGRELGSTDGLGEKFAAQLAEGNGVMTLPVTVTEKKVTAIARMLEVDLSEQRLYLKENGEVIESWLISSGRPGADTITGRYSIGWKTPLQDMRGVALDSGKAYVQEDVPWAMYFNGDQAFHGVYWHTSWGQQMSAGCVGMPVARADQIYQWAPEGTDVVIRS